MAGPLPKALRAKKVCVWLIRSFDFTNRVKSRAWSVEVQVANAVWACACGQFLTLSRVIEALQPDVALCCSLPLWPCYCYAVLCGQGDDGHLIKGALEGVEQPAQHQ